MDNPRVLELRRRVQADPASIAFAQLAEECRRSGGNEEAVRICREGLAYHPDYLSARVTLARALCELGHLDESQTELRIVLAAAPDNLAANRALAEIYQRQGLLNEALLHYKKALYLAQHDPDLEHAVEQIEQVVSPPPPAPVETAPVTIEDLFDFDTLLAQLGGRTQPKPEIPTPVSLTLPSAASAFDEVEPPADAGDPFAVLERQLRESEQVHLQQEPQVTEQLQRDERVIAELEGWLAAILTDRNDRATA